MNLNIGICRYCAARAARHDAVDARLALGRLRRRVRRRERRAHPGTPAVTLSG
jgi:hypothetical protein